MTNSPHETCRSKHVLWRSTERFSVSLIWLAGLDFPKKLHPLSFVSDHLWMFHLCVVLLDSFGFFCLWNSFILGDKLWTFFSHLIKWEFSSLWTVLSIVLRSIRDHLNVIVLSVVKLHFRDAFSCFELGPCSRHKKPEARNMFLDASPDVLVFYWFG